MYDEATATPGSSEENLMARYERRLTLIAVLFWGAGIANHITRKQQDTFCDDCHRFTKGTGQARSVPACAWSSFWLINHRHLGRVLLQRVHEHSDQP
ncbi:hypothetical protein AC579_8711 [Pseudocercospora musae]|uniref:Uncharacterized protein n=1 Tax=Pseudocercospora musae TaxID=113226 RepID=A0A139IW52_9PEZI|nr:hypothetical protein AC579_8711 [Pseudocercospora musae]